MPRQIDWNEFLADINEFSRRIRLLENFHDFPTQIDLDPFHIKSTWTSAQHSDTALDAFTNAVERDILNLTPKQVRDNLTTRERHALKQLRRRTNIISYNQQSSRQRMRYNNYGPRLVHYECLRIFLCCALC